MSFSKPKYPDPPDPPAAQAPVVAATPPDPEEVAAAPEVNKDSQMKQATNTKRKGTSALRIQLNVGGMGGSPARGKGGGGNGLSI